MFIVYVLLSLKNSKRYIGYTSKEVYLRLKEHNNHSNKWTKQNGPFKLLHFEDYSDKKQAMKREKFLKSGVGRKWLDENLI